MTTEIDQQPAVVPRYTIEPGVISPPVHTIQFDQEAVSAYLESRDATPEFIEATHILLSNLDPQHPLFKGSILGLYSNDGNISLFVPAIFGHTSKRKLIRNNWLLSSQEWNDMEPAERLDRVLLHELEHRLDDRSAFGPALSGLNQYFAEVRFNKRFMATKIALGTAALLTNIQLVRQGSVAADSIDLLPLSLVWANYASKFAKIRGLKKVYRTSPHEARANLASIEYDNRFFTVVTVDETFC